MNNKQRNLNIDIIKGLAIFLVLWGHSIQYFSIKGPDFFDNQMFKFIYSFHMPLFMLISGYLFYFSANKRNLKSLLIAKLKSIGIPIITWGLIGSVLYIIKNVLYSNITLESLFIIASNFISLWFLWAVLACSIIVSIVEKLIKSYVIKIICYIFGILIVYYVFPCGVTNLFMYPYFLIGFYFCYLQHKIPKNILKIKYLFVLIFIILIPLYQKKHFIYITGINPFESPLGIFPQTIIDCYRYLIGLVGSVSIITIILEVTKNNILKKLMINTFAKLGFISLQIYILQTILLEKLACKIWIHIVDYIGYNPFTISMSIYNYIITPIIAALFGIFILYIAKAIGKNKTISFILFGKIR